MRKKDTTISALSRHKFINRKNILITSFLLLSILFAILVTHISITQMHKRVNRTQQFVALEGHKIRDAIESRITTAKAMEMYVLSNDGDLNNFGDVAAFYFADDPALRSIQLAPNGVVTKELMYPQEENFVSHDLFADPERKEMAERSRDSGEILLSGPYDLKQGGKGLIVRNPIYLKDENGQGTFWGFSIIVFNVPQIFSIEQLNLLSTDNYFYRLWREIPNSEETQVLIENTDSELSNAIRQRLDICGATWYLDIAPQDKWLPRRLLALLIVVFSVILVLSMMGISYYLKIRELVYTDELLKIGNMNYLSMIYRRMPQHVAEKTYVIAFDIDKFKEFNYMYGDEEGDQLLRYIARIVQEETPKAFLIRYAFDYFVLMNTFDDLKECEQQFQIILDRFRSDIDAGRIPHFEISAGIRKINPGEALQLVINDALLAREAIKGNALRPYAVYDEETRRKRLQYMEMESNLPAAIQNDEFQVYYQPKYNMISEKIIGSEALVRWVKPDGTIITPGDFIPCFENSHQITLLDEIVLRKVCQQMNDMYNDGLSVKPVSVNLSRVHLKDPGFLPKISGILKEFHIDPTMISFEITESAIYEDSIPLQSIVDYLHSLGCKVDMDDYGVGVSGPKALATYTFDTVKLDKSFVDDIANPKVSDIIRSTSYLVKQWGMKVIVEGIETEDQVTQLVGLGCTSAQGFYYSRPIKESEYRELLRTAQKARRGVGQEENKNV